MNDIVQSLYFEDFHVGQKFVTKARTITETDIINFAGVSWDHNQLHTDAEYAAGTPFGKRIAHGLLGVVAHAGLSYQLTEESILALLELNWKFHLPIYIGDTIHVEQKVKDLRESATGDRGILTFEKEVKNQENKVVQTGTTTILLAKRATKKVDTE
jgi:acyl dehydratase